MLHGFVGYGDDLSPVFGLMEPDQIDRAHAAIGGLMADVDRMIGRRANDRRDDLISALLDAEDLGDRLSREEVVAMVGNLIVGGHDTTASQLGCTLLTLLRYPDITDRLRNGTVSASDVVNETIRFEPSIGVVSRTLLAPTVIGGVQRDPGTFVLLSTASANREGEVWGDPDVVRPERFAEPQAPRLLTFGSGAHYCLGAALARMTLEAVVTAFVACDGITPVGDLDHVEWRQVLSRSPAELLVAMTN
jgi:cytochrome P450